MTRRLASLASMTLALIASACAPVGPNYVRPPVPTPTHYRFASLVQAESLADAPWWRVFEDPQLQALIRDAIDSNLDVRAAVAAELRGRRPASRSRFSVRR
jgi:multidrug efflux system outer membrane protein